MTRSALDLDDCPALRKREQRLAKARGATENAAAPLTVDDRDVAFPNAFDSLFCSGPSAFSDMTYEGARSVLGPFFVSLGASAAIVGTVSGAGDSPGSAFGSCPATSPTARVRTGF